jgi:uncharacterized protein
MPTVAILGASDKPDRYAYLALQLLLEKGHQVLPVNPSLQHIDHIPVLPNLAAIQQPVHTLTLYVAGARLASMAQEILDLNPGRVIFNPGTESPILQSALTAAGIPWQEACTLVMLKTGQF